MGVTALRSDETIRQGKGGAGHVSGAEHDDDKLSILANMDTALHQDQIRYSTALKLHISTCTFQYSL